MSSSKLSVIVDNGDPNFNFSSAWTLSARDTIWYNDTYSYFTTGGGNATISYGFQGTSLTLYGHGDGESWAIVGTDSQTYSPPAPLFQIFRPWYSSGALADGRHAVQVTLPSMTYFDYAVVDVGQEMLLADQTIILDDGDPAMNYSSGWTAIQNAGNFDLGNGMMHEAYKQTTHQSRNAGDYVVFQFTGTSVAVYGIVQWQYFGRISTAYIIDGSDPPQTHTISSSGNADPWKDQPTYQFFQSNDLDPGNHTLVVTITEISAEQVFTVDFVLYNASFANLAAKPNLTAADMHPWTAPPLTLPKKKLPIGALVGGVVGGVALFCLIFLAMWIFWKRRRRYFAKQREPRIEIDPTPTVVTYPTVRDRGLYPLPPYRVAPSSSDARSSIHIRTQSLPEHPVSPTTHAVSSYGSDWPQVIHSSRDRSASSLTSSGSPTPASAPPARTHPSQPPTTFSEQSPRSYFYRARDGNPSSPHTPHPEYEQIPLPLKPNRRAYTAPSDTQAGSQDGRPKRNTSHVDGVATVNG